MKSPVEKLNEIKEKELRLKEEQARKGENVENSDNSFVGEKETSYSQKPSNKGRVHKGSIGLDHDPGTV